MIHSVIIYYRAVYFANKSTLLPDTEQNRSVLREPKSRINSRGRKHDTENIQAREQNTCHLQDANSFSIENFLKEKVKNANSALPIL